MFIPILQIIVLSCQIGNTNFEERRDKCITATMQCMEQNNIKNERNPKKGWEIFNKCIEERYWRKM